MPKHTGDFASMNTGGTPPTYSLVAPSETPLPAALPLFATGLGALGLLGWRRKRKALAVVAVAALVGASVWSHPANALTFNFSFTDLTGTVTGEIGGLVDNTNNQAATSVTILSAPFGLVVPVSAPIGDATVNNFFVDGGVILSGGFLDTFAAFNSFGPDTVTLRLVIGQPTSVDFGSLTQSFNFCGECLTTGPLTINSTPLPAALPLFATGLGALGLLGWRRKRKQAA